MTTSHDPSSSSKSRPPAISAADTVHEALEELERLCEDIEHFIIHLAHRAQYRAPIIDWHHADEYAQKDIVGLKKFLAAAEAERQYVEGLSTGPIIPKDFTSNSPHILAVWHEFTRAPWPLTSIGQAIEYDDPATSANSASSSTHKAGDAKAKQKGKQHVKGGKLARQGKTGVKVDVVCKGGDEWIKVNTMKESRLLQEFREQDSYINSDYDSDPDSDVDVRAASGSLGNCPNEPDDPRGHSSEYQSNGCKQNGRQTRHLRSPPPLTNSLISQAESLLYAAKHVPLLPGRRQPTIRLILPRLQPMLPPSLSPSPSTSSSSVASSRSTFDSMLWQDVRTGQTLDHLTKMGITVQLGPTPTPAWEAGEKVPLIPTRKILLDLSVLVALCCESSHMALPRDEGEHQARFRAMRIVHDHDCPDAPIGPEGEQGAVSKVSYGRAGDDGPGQGKMHGTNGNGAMAATSDERRHRCRGINHVADAVTPRGGSRGDQIDPYTAAPRLELGPHTNASRDLSDQLAWESQHPLIGELRDRLTLPRSTSSSQTTEPERIGASGRPGHMTEGAEASGPVEFWVTQEVYKRLPGLVDIIGGPGERARARALFAHAQSATVGVDEPTDDDDHNEVDGTNDTNGTKGQEDDGAAFAGMIQQKAGDGSSIGRNADFWRGSRWEGKEGVLAGLRVRVLPGTDMEDDFDFEQATPIGSASGDGAGAAAKPSLDEKMADLDIAPDGHLTTDGGQASTSASARTSSNSMVGASSRSPFASCLVDACHALLAASQSTSTSTPSNGFPLASPGTPKRDRRNRHRPSTLSVHHTTRLPSGHTLRTLMHGAARGWTVLTNNRGAVGKVCREMGIGEGLGVGDMRAQENGQGGEEWTEGQERQVERQGEEAAVWIVNPSSLSEWRRREVEKENERVRAEWDALMGQECAGPGIREVGER